MVDSPIVPVVDFLEALPAAKTVGAHQAGATPLLAVHLGAAARVVVAPLAGAEVLEAGRQVGVVMEDVQHMAVVTGVGLLMAATAHAQHTVAPLRTEEQHPMVVQLRTVATMAHAQLMVGSVQATAHPHGVAHRETLPSPREVSQPRLLVLIMHQRQAHMPLPLLGPMVPTLRQLRVVRPWTPLLPATTLLPLLETAVLTSMGPHLLQHRRQVPGNLLHQRQVERILDIIEAAKVECV